MSRWGSDPRDSDPGDRANVRQARYRDYPTRTRNLPDREIPTEIGERQVYRDRDREYRLNDAEVTVIRDVGRFRIVDSQDLAKFIYKSQPEPAQRDLRHLEDQKLIRFVKIPGKERIKYATLTKQGKELVSRHFRRIPGQEIYYGVKKLREAEHDAAVYRMYRAEADRLREKGFQPRRIKLDYELKRDVQRELARERQKYGKDLPQGRMEIAEKNKLTIVNNAIQIPDLRIEYRGEDDAPGLDMSGGSVDLEYVSDHYKPGQIAAKRAAGFTMYHERGGGRSAYGPDLMMEVLR
jgi:DNA-binding MarR family transcriptional regulator